MNARNNFPGISLCISEIDFYIWTKKIFQLEFDLSGILTRFIPRRFRKRN